MSSIGVTSIGVRSILLALSFRVKKVKKYVAYYLPVAARILFLIPGFSRKTNSAHFNNKKQGLRLISFHARRCLFNLLLLPAISPKSEEHLPIELIDLRLKERIMIRVPLCVPLETRFLGDTQVGVPRQRSSRKETLTMRISEAPAVRTGGPQTWMPLVTKTCVRFFNLYPQLNSYWPFAMKFKGNNCPLCVWPESRISAPLWLTLSRSVGRWSRTMTGRPLSQSRKSSLIDFRPLDRPSFRPTR